MLELRLAHCPHHLRERFGIVNIANVSVAVTAVTERRLLLELLQESTLTTLPSLVERFIT